MLLACNSKNKKKQFSQGEGQEDQKKREKHTPLYPDSDTTVPLMMYTAPGTQSDHTEPTIYSNRHFLKNKLYYLYFGTIVSNSQNGSLQAV